MIVLAFIGLIGLGATILLPAAEPAPGADVPAPAADQSAAKAVDDQQAQADQVETQVAKEAFNQGS